MEEVTLLTKRLFRPSMLAISELHFGLALWGTFICIGRKFRERRGLSISTALVDVLFVEM